MGADLNLFRKLWIESTRTTAWFSLFFSLVALATSIRSCEHAATSANIAELDFMSKQMLVLRLEKKGGNRSFELVPLDSNFHLQAVKIFYPTEIEGIADSQPYLNEITFPVDGIGKLIENKVPRQAGVVLSGDPKLPIVLEADYVVQGQRHNDRSLYYLEFFYFVKPELRSPVEIVPQVLTFVGHINPVDDPYKLLSKELVSQPLKPTITFNWN